MESDSRAKEETTRAEQGNQTKHKDKSTRTKAQEQKHKNKAQEQSTTPAAQTECYLARNSSPGAVHPVHPVHPVWQLRLYSPSTNMSAS
jgi:hypothetical protein